MSSDWDEIRKLAADLQRAQLSGSIQKLSERNCIEIINKLVETGLLNIIFTSDGKEYVTPNHLQREISDLLYVSGGRVGLSELSQSLNVDYSQVEAQAELLARHDSEVHFVLGQLIHASYLDKIAYEINEKLQLVGIASTSDFTKEFNLPSDFIFDQLVSKRLGSIIEGFQDEHDPKVILTSSYLSRNRARIRGALSGVTSPTSLANIVSRFGFDGRLFMNLTEQLVRDGRLQGTITGGKQLTKAVYVPNAFAKAQGRWIDDFLAQNGYLEYDALKRLGLSDPQGAVKRRCKDEELVFLSSCCVAQSVVDQVISAVDLAVGGADAWVDVMPLLPSVLSDKDASQLLLHIVSSSQKKGQWVNAQIYCDTIVVSKTLLGKLREPFREKMNDKASKVINDGSYAAAIKQSSSTDDKKILLGSNQDQSDKKEERRKKATGGKGGGGTQGRETKTKSTKKKNVHKRRGDSDDEDGDDFQSEVTSKKRPAALQFMSLSELSDNLRQISVLQDAPDDLFEALGSNLLPDISREYEEIVASLYQSAVTSTMQNKRKTLGDFQDKTNAMVETIRLYDKGLTVFEGIERQNLEKHLIKSLCSEVMTELVRYVCQEEDVEVDTSKEMNADQRLKLFGQLPREAAEPLVAIHKALGENSVSGFLSALESNLPKACGVSLLKQDKKKDRQLLFNHRHSLLDQLERCHDPAVVLHLTSLIIFQAQTGNMLHASGKFVPVIGTQISSQMTEEQKEVLSSFQSLVIRQLSLDPGQEKDEIQKQLEQQIGAVKAVATACDGKRAK